MLRAMCISATATEAVLVSLPTLQNQCNGWQRKTNHFSGQQSYDLMFSELKGALVIACVLAHVCFKVSFRLDIKASAYSLGTVLIQEHNGFERVLAYCSLSFLEINYCTNPKEFLPVVKSTEALTFI